MQFAQTVIPDTIDIINMEQMVMPVNSITANDTVLVHNHYLQMQNDQNHRISKCQKHSFSLKALHDKPKQNLNAAIILCRSKHTKHKKSCDQCKGYDAPTFNRDKCHATPSFILPSEKIEYLQSTREFIRSHQKKVREYAQPQDQLYVPKPRSKGKHCNVCRQNYEEYLDHIHSAAHRTNIRSCLFNSYILEMEHSFKSENSQQNSLQPSEIGNDVMERDQEELIGERGRKLIKTNAEVKIDVTPGTWNENYTSSNMFMPLQAMQTPLFGFGGFNSCRSSVNYYPAYGNNSFYPFLNRMYDPSTYPIYCLSYPMVALDIYPHQ